MVPNADHYFAGKLEQMQHALRSWIETNFCPATSHSPIR
jgi:hypothetical protein